MNYCEYYQAFLVKKNCGIFVSILRSFEHLAFDRTLDKENSHFEFFVPSGREDEFKMLMLFFVEQGIVHTFFKLPNRLLDPKIQL